VGVVVDFEVGIEQKKAFEQFDLVGGIDEVGRGPLAGPVVACCVVFDKNVVIEGLRDSKKLSAKKRKVLKGEILEKAVEVRVSFQHREIIDDVNIYQAAKKAMLETVQLLDNKVPFFLIDAMELPIEQQQLSLVKGDAREPVIMAASIVAKEVRDDWMKKAGEEYPGYGLEKHMGYGTQQHMKALAELGVTPLHRRSFKPVTKAILESEPQLKRELASMNQAQVAAFVANVREWNFYPYLAPHMSLVNERLRELRSQA